MARQTKPRRLKVYRTQIGFHDWLVAAANQKAALEAWDVRKNLFADGSAQVVTDKASIDLAMKTPGQPVRAKARRDLAKAGRALRLDDPRKHPKTEKASASVRAPKKKPKPDRSRLDRAEEALAEFKRRAVRERSALLREQKALDLKARRLEDDLDAEEDRLEKAVDEARKRYEADGEDAL